MAAKDAWLAANFGAGKSAPLDPGQHWMELVSLDLQPSWDVYVEKVLGYEFAQWDMHAPTAMAKINDARGVDVPRPQPLEVLGRWQPPWVALSEECRAAAQSLGWASAEDWDDNSYLPAATEYAWDELKDSQRTAASVLGYSQAIWDGEDELENGVRCDSNVVFYTLLRALLFS
eukprot:SAG31_NODE_764_length_12262_cov_26.578887_11_plen_174_part_00